MTTAISPVTGHYVDVEVAGVTYQVFYLENGSGIPLLCQHTAGGHNHQWRNLLRDPDVTGNYRVIAYDLPFHGKSDPPHDTEWWKEEFKVTNEFEQEFIAQFIRALDLEKPVFMGASLGGIMALHLAHDQPEKFRALVALEATEKTPDFYLDWWNHPAVDGSSVIPSVIDGIMAPQTPEIDRRLSMFYYSQAAAGVMKGGVYSWSREHDMTDTVAEIDTSKTPLYMLTGEYDYLATPALSAATAAKIPGVTLQIMSGLGHFPMTEDYAAFKSYIVPVLNEIASR
jgi:pimeloyl-ACP methyl ester carboxylesterase